MSRFITGLSSALFAITSLGRTEPAFAGPAAPGAEKAAAFSVRVVDEEAARSVRRAVAGAHERLGREGCKRIFGVFRDPSGRTLDENLTALGKSGQQFLEQVLFYDGSQLAICQEAPARVVYAATERGSRVVRVCTTQFEALQRRTPVWGDVVVIHEMLHSLGLGEAPPSSDEITWQVMESCS
jgi:hypothetical protein